MIEMNFWNTFTMCGDLKVESTFFSYIVLRWSYVMNCCLDSFDLLKVNMYEWFVSVLFC